jgi:hypothetical protein
MERDIKDLLAYDQSRYICGRSGHTTLVIKYDSKGREEYIVTCQYFKSDPPEEVYRGLDEEEAVKVFTQYD